MTGAIYADKTAFDLNAIGDYSKSLFEDHPEFIDKSLGFLNEGHDETHECSNSIVDIVDNADYDFGL